ncbi:hypothetical protein E4U19_005963, partial [Claviceps sp. Clav32 group G5]
LLWAAFIARRKADLPVRHTWFRRRAQELFRQLYPKVIYDFIFSDGWFNGFKIRWNIVPRRITKQASKRPAEYLEIVGRFLRFIRRMCHPSVPGMLRQFALSHMFNFDETLGSAQCQDLRRMRIERVLL